MVTTTGSNDEQYSKSKSDGTHALPLSLFLFATRVDQFDSKGGKRLMQGESGARLNTWQASKQASKLSQTECIAEPASSDE